MIKKVKNSLFAKVFFITAAMLLSISLLVYSLLAWLMPQTYSDRLNAALDEQVQTFISELEQTAFSDSGGLFDRFAQSTGIYALELYDSEGILIPLPSNRFSDEQSTFFNEQSAYSENVAVTYVGENIPVPAGSYYFSFSDSSDRYMLTVYGTAEQIAWLQQSFLQLFPLLLLIISAVAIAASWLYSRVIAKLQNANRKLEADIEHKKELELARTNFFSAVSHELKTPVTIIKGQLEGMLLGIGVYKDREKYLARSLEIVNTLETMVQEILTISRLETAGGNFQKECLDCIWIIQSYLNETEDLIVKKELKIYLDIPPETFIYGNKMLMEKVFSNLIGNAVKYSPPGASVRISSFTEFGKQTFSIENTGTHIPEDSIPQIFDAFYRVEQSRNRQTGGSGLGLYIVQEILHRYGSECMVCNTQSGVRFSFSI